MKITVRATPEEWEQIGPFIRKLSSWRSFAKNCTLSAVSVVQTPNHFFKDRISRFEYLYGSKASLKTANAILNLDAEGRFAVAITLSDEDAALVRLFYNDHIEMVAE